MQTGTATGPTVLDGPGRDSIERLGAGEALSRDELVELIGAFNDVTAHLQQTHARLTAEVSRLRGQLEEKNAQLERSRRLAALGEMAAGIAHEVRNPLGSIGLYADMLREDLEADRPEQAETALKIREAVRGLNAIVGDVLHLAREMPLRVDRCDPGDVMARALDCCAAELDGVEVSAGSYGAFLGDAEMLHRALVNLVRNAADAVREVGGPDRSVRVECGDLGSSCEDALPVVIRVIDRGDGINEEVRDRMFNPFFTTRETGTGLGLALVHRIAEAHGGVVAIWNNSDREPGARGATAELRLPRGSKEAVT
ncbi:MAG: ATP-binding protein [Planctomycetota bacterium]